MTDISKPRLTDDFVTITRKEYEKLKAAALYAELAGDFVADMPVWEDDLFKEDPRYKRYLKMVNPEWHDELYGADDGED